MSPKSMLGFIGKVVVVHAVTYFVAGAIAFPLLTGRLYQGPGATFATFMRSPDLPAEWRHVITWAIPGEILRGALLGVVYCPFLGSLQSWSFRRRFLALAALYLVLGFWASVPAAPGTIEGLIYMRPNITPYAHLLIQPEIIAQALLMAAWLAHWMRPGAQPGSRVAPSAAG